jgi:ribosomal protein S18 acetylase RimI-like enzyme
MTQSLAIPTKRQPFLRPARAQDIDAIANLGAKTFASSFGYSMPASDLQAYLEAAYSPSSIAKDLANPLIDIIVTSDETDRVIGFVQLTQGTIEPCIADVDRPIELQRLYVDESYHGGGIGRALENEVERISRERGFKTMWLGVWEENFKAQKAYERFGFSKVGSHDFVMGTCVQTDWILTKDL